MKRRTSLFITLVVLAAVLGGSLAALAQAPGRVLGQEDILLYGLGLRVEPVTQTVPKDIATIVSTYLQAPQTPSGLPPFASDAVVKATLRGPGLQAPLDLQAAPNSPFAIPPLTVAGTYTLENIRLESQGALLLRSNPESVTITVIDKLLVTQITARPLSASEIREKGIVFDASNFQAYNFTAAFAVAEGGNPISVNFPVVLPSLQSAADATAPSVTIGTVATPQLTTIKTIVPDTLKIATQIPNLAVVGFALTAPELKGQELIVPAIPGVIVIPGDIGFLNQYFSVMLMVGNAAPVGSNLSVTNLTAEIVLPPGNDQVVNTVDDPLRMAMTAKGEAPRLQPVVQAGPDGQLGTADDVVTLGPGESGNAEFLVEGRREGSHTVEMSIAGTLLGLPVGPVQITGRAIGAVLVRNPTFTLTFTHPETVVAGEQYSLDVTVTNTSSSPANFVSVNLYGPNVSGATVVGDATREIETIPAGDSATVSFDLVARLTGTVTAATLDSDENVAGRFQLKTAVGIDGIPLSPDSLVLPKEASALPKGLRDAALGLLGKAWAVATAPAGALPKGVARFSKQIVLDRAVEVAEAGFRVSLHEPIADSGAQLLMDFAGSNLSRIPELFPVADQPFALGNFTGFDALRRSSVRGDAFAAAVANLLAPDLAASGAAAFHRALATKWGYRPGFVSVLLSSSSAPAPFDVAIVDAQGRRVGGTDAGGKFVKEIPFSDVLAFTDGRGQRAATMLLLAAPEAGAYTIRLSRVAGTPADAPSTLSLLSPTADQNGDVRQLVFDGVTASAAPSYTPADADPFRFAFELVGDDAAASPSPVAGSVVVVPDATPTVVGVVQQADADVVRCDTSSPGYQLGRVVAILFSEEVTAASVQDRLAASQITAFAPEANQAVGVALQPGRRIAFVAMRDPFGPYVPRTMTVTGVEDLRRHALGSWSGPMEATVGENGAVVSGRIIQSDGTALSGANVRLFAILPCELGDAKVGISSKYADAAGVYSWDFVRSDLRASITAVDPTTNEFRSIPFDISRAGQRMNVDIVLLGRGTFMGRVLAPDGRTPLAGSQIRVTSLTDNSQYGATTDAQGAFTIARVPVGNIFVEAVNVSANARYNFSEYIPFAGAAISRDIVLIPADSQQQRDVKYASLSGHVLQSDGATPVAGAPVIAYYQNGSQPGVSCPPSQDEFGELAIPAECPVGIATSGADGGYAIPQLPVGNYRLYAFDQPSLAEGEVRYTLPEGSSAVTILLNGGLATVRGVVVDSTGARVPGARVGGGLTLSTADANGAFELTDVPIGRRTIVAVSDALGVTGSAEVDIAIPGEIVNVTIVLPAAGAIAGRVTLADGTTPAAGVAVYVFQEREKGSYAVLGQATSDASGAYRIDRILKGAYQVSAFAGDFSDGNIAPAVLRYDKQVLRVDIRFRGAGGRVSGTVFDSDGNTPLAARVGVSGARIQIAGGKVGVGFVPVSNFAIMDTGLDGKFSFGGLLVGDFTLRAVGQFSPDPIETTGRIQTPGQQVTVDLKLQATSQVAGVVYQPDGVTPAPNVSVTFKSDAFRMVCSGAEMNDAGDPKCESVPQGIQAEYAVTDATGRFLVPLVNAGAFTLSFEDAATGKVAQVHGTVRPGERAEMSARLLGRGVLTIRVLASDGRTPIPGAKVDVQQTGFPGKALTMFADAEGALVLSGGDALSEGEVAILVRDVRNGFTGRGSAAITHDGEEVSASVYIFDAWGTVSGTVFKSDGVTPVPNAEVVVSVAGKGIGYTLTDAAGNYTQDTVPLGPFSVDVFEAATSRIGYGSGSIDLDKQTVTLNVTEVAIGLVTGTAIDSSVMAPLPGWSVSLSPRLASGRTLATLSGMTAADGTFSFPGVSKGVFTLAVRKEGVSGSASATGEIYTEGQRLDIPLLVKIAHPLYGRIEGVVRNPDGSPASYAAVSVTSGPDTVAAADGSFSFAELPLGRYQVSAKAQTSGSAGSVWVDLEFNGDLVQVTIPMVGLTAVHGQAVYADNSPASGAQVTFVGVPASGCDGGCTKYADANGEFSFTQLPARSFTLWAADPVRNLKGSVGGAINPGEDKAVRVVLQPSALVQGRVLSAGGLPAAGVTCELKVGGQDLFVGTGGDGRFSYPAAPLGAYTLDFSDPVGTGIARRAGTLTADLDFGDIRLDEAPPQVASLTPAASAARVPLDQVVTVVFSEPIDPAGVTASGIALAGPAGPVTGILALGGGDTTVTFTPLAAFKDEARYTLTLTGIKDRLGKVMPDFTASFTTVDITPPSAVDLSPAQSSSGVPIYTPIRIKFSEPIDPTAWGTAPLALTTGGAIVAGRLDYLYGNTVVAYTPTLPLSDGATYRVQLAAATDLAGNVQAQGLDYTFSTTDRTPPQIASLTALTGATVIENTIARVQPDLGTAFDVAVVDYYLNGTVAGSSRTAPFTFAFQATPALGTPGDTIAVTAIATDTSGNRGAISLPLVITVTADQPPAIAITSPADGAAYRNGARVTVSLHATDDVGLVTLGYKAQTGKPQDAGTFAVSPSATDQAASFTFDVPLDAVPGSTIQVQASAVDTKGQVTPAAPVSFTVLDAVAPVVAISGSASGDKVKAGQTVTVTVNASDAGGLKQVAFVAAGLAAASETRQIPGGPTSVVTAFTFTVSPTATTGDTVLLDATAADMADNAGTAARVVLTVSDVTPPTVTVRTADGSATVLPGQTVDVVAQAADDQAVARVDLAGQGAFNLSDSRQVSPPSNGATVHFTVIIPASAEPGATETLTARATDVAGNVSGAATVVLSIGSSVDLAMPASIVVLAGDTRTLTVQTPAPAPAGGLVVTFSTGDASIAYSTPSLTIPEGQSQGTITVTAVSGGTTPLRAYLQGALRATTTVAVQGGVVSGVVYDDLLAPIAGAEVTVGTSLAATTDGNGFYQVTGATGALVSVKAVDPVSHKRGSATATLNQANGFAKNVNVVLIAAGGVRGTVFAADGATPAGPGVQVDIYDQADLSHSLNTTFTDADSRYEFPVVTEGAYLVEALSTAGERGRAAAMVASGQDVTADIAYLGSGTVTGVVRDGSNAPVPNAQVVLNASSVFGAAPPTTIAAGPDGTFSFSSVLVGSFWIRATDPRTGQAGVASGVVGRDQQTVPVEIIVASYGSLQGTVYRSDGTTTVASARVTAQQGYVYQWATTDSDGRYQMPVVPLGTYEVSVYEAATRGTAKTTATIAANGEVKTVDLTLLPQGTVVVTVVDAGGQVVPGATVTVKAGTDTINGLTGADGIAVITHVLAGDLAISASFNGLTGQTTSSVAGDGTATVTVQLEPVASVAGVAMMPDGETPAGGSVKLVYPSALPGDPALKQAALAADGSYRFDGVPLGSYKVAGYDPTGRFRAVSPVFSLSTPGQVGTANLTFVGLGSVTGRVLNIDSSSAGNAAVQVRSLNPTFGGYWSARTDAAGYYQVVGVPVGSVYVLAGDVSQGIFAEATGTLGGDGQTLVVDLLLKNNSTYFPVSFHDANGMPFTVAADGTMTTDSWLTSVTKGGLKLELETGGVTTPFAGSAVGTLEAGGRGVAARQQGVAGLDVTRRVFVPVDGYFARYVDTLTNPGTSPVTVNVWVTSYVNVSTLAATSSGDAVLDVADAATADRWFTADSGSTGAKVGAFVFDGAGAARPVAMAAFAPSNSAVWRWDNVTVPPGGSVAFLYFVAQQASRPAAQATAERLVQLPPEALASLREDDLAAIQNFAVPADGVSAVAALPLLAGVVTGQVVEADTTTPVPWSQVAFTSGSPYFAWTRRVNADASGQFRFEANLSGAADAMAVPVDAFSLLATYPSSGVSSPLVVGTFQAGQSQAAANIVFTTTASVIGSVRRADGTVVGSGSVSASGTWNGTSYSRTATIAADGSFSLTGQPPIVLTLTASVPHPQGSANTGSASVTLMAGQAQTVSISLAPTGTVQGTVRNGGGTAAANVTVRLTSGSFARSVATDTSGAFTLTDVPVGGYTLSVTEPTSGVASTAAVTVVAGQTTAQDLQFVSVGIVRGTVRDAAGAVAVNASVALVSSVTSLGTLRATTNASGAYQFTGVPLGSFTVGATSAAKDQYGETAGAVASDGQQVVADIAMVSNILSLPRTSYDANSLTYDFQQNGRIRYGYNSVFVGTYIPSQSDPYGAARLSLIADGAETAFAGAATALGEHGNRELAIAQQGVAGLDVTRKIYVPETGYFARYLEELSNPGTSPVTVDVKIASDFGYYYCGYYNCTGWRPTIQTTSNGGTVLDVISVDSPDRWVVLDDSDTLDIFRPNPSSTRPAAAFVFDGPGASQRVAAASYTTPSAGLLTYRWNSVTVPPGGRVILMHFVVQQSSTAAGVASAQRLVQLPPEAVAGLSADEIPLIANFSVPADGSSALEAPPALTGTVTGQVREADGTPIRNAQVYFTSDTPYFSRWRQGYADGSGNFQFASQFTANGNTAIPVSPFTLTAIHPSTSLVSAPAAGSFPEGQSVTTENVVFTNAAVVTGYLRKQGGVAVADTYVSLQSGTASYSAYTDSSGAFTFRGLAAGTWSLSATLPGSRWLTATAAVTTLAGQSVAADLTFPPTGIVQGAVRRADGTAVSYAYVYIVRLSDGDSYSVYGADGLYAFADVPSGDYAVYATDPRTGAKTQVPVTVAQDQVTVRDITLAAAGSLQVQVNFARGDAAGGARVDVMDSGTNGYFSRTIYVDAAGRGTVTPVAGGPITVRAYHPSSTSFRADVATELSTEGQVVPVTITLPAVVTITAHTVVSTGTAIPSLSTYLYRSSDLYTSLRSATTDSTGTSTLGLAASGTDYTVMAQRTVASYNSYYLKAYSAPFTPTSDGDTVTAAVTLPAIANSTVAVVKADGTTPFGSSVIYVKNAYLPNFQNQGYTASSTGTVALPLPEGQYTIRVADYNSGATLVEQSGTIQASDEGRAMTITIPVGAASGTVTGQVFAADGATPVPSASVKLVNVLDQRVITSTTVGSDGKYTFTNVRAGTGGFIIRATMPSSAYDSTPVDVPGSIAADGATVTVNVTMPFASMTISGVVFAADGSTPVTYSYVRAYNAAGTQVASARTTSSGAYGPFTVWSGMAGVTLRAFDQTGYVFVEKVQQPGASGGTFTVNFNVPIVSGAIQGKVVAADGVTPVYDAFVEIVTADGRSLGSTWTELDGTFSYSATVPTAGAVIRASYTEGPVSDQTPATVPITLASPGATVTADFTLPLSVVRGHAVYADGSAVGRPSIKTVGADSQDRDTMTSDPATGTFVVLGTPVGPFRTYVTDWWSPYFTGFADATIADITVPVDVEVVLPARGTVSARVVDSAGQPVAGAWVVMSAPGAPYVTDEPTDTSGIATLTAPAGPISLQACPGAGACAMASGTVTAGEVLTLDLVPRPTGTLKGRLFRTDGVSPYANTGVSVESYAASGNAGNWAGWATTDPTGQFTLAGVPAGTVYVEVYDGSDADAIRVPVTIVAGATNTMQASGGSGGYLPTLASGGAQFGIYSAGTLSSASLASLSNPYSYSYDLSVNGSSYYPAAENQGIVRVGAGLEFGPSNADALIVKRKIDVFGSKPYVRFLETIYNPTAVPLPASVMIDANVRDAGAVVAPGTTANTYAITGTPSGRYPLVAHVFEGSGAPAARTGVSFVAKSSLGYVWATVVPPGGTVEFMHFSAIGDPTDVAGLQSLAQALVDLSDPDALTGLTDQERARILNFSVPGGKPVVSGNIRGTVVTQDGTTPAVGATVQAMDAFTGHLWASATTDSLGAFSLDNVPNGDGGVAVAATLAAYPGESGGAAINFTQADQTITGVVLALQAGELTGRVTASGAPVPNPTVIVAQTDSSGTVTTRRSWQSGTDGTFIVLGLVPGPFTLTVVDSAGQIGTTVQGSYDGVKAVSLDVALPAAATCMPPPAGLRGFWKGEADASDSVHPGNDGTLEGGVSIVPARVGSGFAFDGVTGLAKIPDTRGDLRPATLTVSAWVKFNSLDSTTTPQAGEQEILFKKKGTLGPLGWFEGYALAKTRIAPGDDRFAFYMATPDEQDIWTSQISRTKVEAGRYYHVVGTADGQVGRLYVDGVLEATFPFPYPVDGGTGALVLGGTGEPDWDPRCDCVIDEVQLFDRAIGADQVQAMFAATSAGLCPALKMLPATLPVSYVGANTADLLRAVNGLSPVTFGSLNPPPGMTVTSDGYLSGTPTSAGSFVFDATATDASAASATSQYTKTVQACLALPPGLVSLWSGEGDALDSLGANNGALSAGGFGVGKVGSAFLGSPLRMDSQTAPLALADSFTIEFWAKPTSYRYSTTESTSGTAGTSGQSYAITPEFRDGGAGAGVSVGTSGISVFEHGSGYLPSPLVYNVTISDWTHIAVVYENKTPKLYVNGVLVRVGLTSPQAHVFAPKSLGDPFGYGPYKGMLDEVALYSRALTASEIKQIYTAGSEGRCETVIK